jgi:hypothetical protein
MTGVSCSLPLKQLYKVALEKSWYTVIEYVEECYMKNLTSHERLMRIFRNEQIDRPALKLWGAAPNADGLLHESYRPVAELAAEKTDLFVYSAGYDLDVYAGAAMAKLSEERIEETNDPNWKNYIKTIHTPKGDLSLRHQMSALGDPGYEVEHYIKDEDDIEKLLSLPYEAPEALSRDHYDRSVASIGDRGVSMISLPHAAFSVETLMGSEMLAYLSVDNRELVDTLCATYARRIYDHTKKILETGIENPIFSWVGPELFLPPLMSPKDFDDFVYKYDKPLCDLIHEHGGYVWVHSHGKVAKFMDRFIDMGVDVLNPLEPGPNGDIVMSELVEKYKGRIGLEGNIEIQEILLSSRDRLAALIDECVEAGEKSGRFILCPSAGYMEYARPTEKYIENLQFFIRYGLETVERYRK